MKTFRVPLFVYWVAGIIYASISEYVGIDKWSLSFWLYGVMFAISILFLDWMIGKIIKNKKVSNER